MLPATITKSVAQQLDKWVLYTMNYRLPDTFEGSYRQTPAFEKVVEHTKVDLQKTAVYALSAPGEHPIWLQTMGGPLRCQVKVQPAVDPYAPLLLYHHGFSEFPYYGSWRRIFSQLTPFPAHTVCIQAPFHDNWLDPFNKGLASLQNMYQIFAGSLRMMQLVHSHFQARGTPFTVLAGVSWGGITSLLYQGLFRQARAVIPMLSSPNLAQVMWDAANLFDRQISVPPEAVRDLLDFTPYYRRCQPQRIFPLLGEHDLFFRIDKHATLFQDGDVVTTPEGHITGLWRVEPLRQHILEVLAWAKNNP